MFFLGDCFQWDESGEDQVGSRGSGGKRCGKEGYLVRNNISFKNVYLFYFIIIFWLKEI